MFQQLDEDPGSQGASKAKAQDPLQKPPGKLLQVRCVFDLEGRFIAVEQESLQLFGFTPPELLGSRYMDLVAPEDQELTSDVAIQIMNGAVIENFENYYRCKNGQRRRILWWAEWNKELQQMHCVAMDADSLDQQTRPDETYQKLYRAYRLAQIGWWEFDLHTQRFLLSDEVYLIYGLNREETPLLPLHQFLALVHPEDRETVRQQLAAIQVQTALQFEHRMIKPGGDSYHVIHYVQTERNAEGSLLAVNGTVKNITERKSRALELERQRAEAQRYANQLLDILESMDQCFFACDEQLICTFCNEKAAEAFGLPKLEIIGRRVEDVICKDRVTPFCERLIAALRAGDRTTYEAYSQKRAGWLEVSISKGNSGYSIYLKDVSERHEKEEALRLSEEKYKQLFTNSSIPKMIYKDGSFRFTDVNDAALKEYGYTREEFLALSVYEVSALPREELDGILLTYHNGNHRPFTGMDRHRVRSGALINVEISSHPIHLVDGTHYIVVANNVTEKVRLQKQMVEEKIAAQKALAQAIIETQEKERSEVGKELHDNVNQLLATAKLYIENISYYPEQSAQFIEKSAALVQRSINEIRFLSKALVTPVLKDVCFRDTLLELINSYTEVNPFAITHAFDFEEAEIDPGIQLTIYRILQEQFNNTIKYAQASEVKILLKSRKGELVYRYEDDGVGFDPGTRKAGLGLNNMRNRAEVYKGQVSIDSAPGSGCRIEVRFPL